jgi:hypothetical protein
MSLESASGARSVEERRSVRHGAPVTSARRLAHFRLIVAASAVALPLLLPFAAGRLLPGFTAIAGAVGVVSLVVGSGVFFYFAFRWCPRCPQCGNARFVRTPDRDENLACPSCGFREATGYTP